MAEKRISAREAGVTCKTCKFFDPLNPDAKNGKCRNFCLLYTSPSPRDS